MSRLIDADAFLKDILTAGIGKTIIEYSESDIGYMIRKRHTIDAVPAVRCRACGTGDAIGIIEDAPAADVAPIEALERLRDEMCAQDLITMEGLRKLNTLIWKYTTVHDGGQSNDR